jgi:hypothetical protein
MDMRFSPSTALVKLSAAFPARENTISDRYDCKKTNVCDVCNTDKY